MKEEDLRIVERQRLVGKFWCNFSVLEIALRAKIAKKTGRPLAGTNAKVGEKVPVNPMVDYSSFPALYNKFNCLYGCTIDFSLIHKFRDAIAHGRLIHDPSSNKYILIKFSKPTNASVTVEFREDEFFDRLYSVNKRLDKVIESVIEIS